MIGIKVSGNFNKTNKFLNEIKDVTGDNILDKYGRAGVDALRSATPKDTGLTADSWDYKIIRSKDKIKIIWTNSSKTENGTPIVILLQYGHATGTGGYVYGVDFINPALEPIFQQITEEVWEEVKRL